MQNEDLLLWGHSLSQYCDMFDLTNQDLNKKILDCASGYATFNVEAHHQGKKVISCDSVYDLSVKDLEQYFNHGLQNLENYLQKYKEKFILPKNSSITEIIKNNKKIIHKFIQDFPEGKQEGRYVATVLPKLPFTPNQFDLALCAYFLFSALPFSQQFSLDVIKSMCQVANEARIYPILNIEGEMPPELPFIILQLQKENYGVEIKQVKYEFQKKNNAMLRVWAQGCEVI